MKCKAVELKSKGGWAVKKFTVNGSMWLGYDSTGLTWFTSSAFAKIMTKAEAQSFARRY